MGYQPLEEKISPDKFERSNWLGGIGGVKERKEKGGRSLANSLCLDAAANAFKDFHKSYTA